jgi:hypothetical protein
MAVKRLTIELDDVPDAARQTSLPASLREERALTAASTATTTPDQQADYQQQEATLERSDVAVRRGAIGRTPSDLVFAFFDKPEFMATALTIISFIIFAKKVALFSDFKLPLLTSAVLNAIWFGIRMIRYVRKRFSTKSA